MELKKQCPICGTMLDNDIQYCSNCGFYVGDVAPINNESESEPNEDILAQTSSDPKFNELDTILSKSDPNKPNVSLSDLESILNSSQTLKNDDSEDTDNSVEAPKRRVPKNSRLSNLFHNKQESTDPKEDEESNLNDPSHIVIQDSIEETDDWIDEDQNDEVEEDDDEDISSRSLPFYTKFINFVLDSLKRPSLLVQDPSLGEGLTVLIMEAFFLILSVQLLFNSGTSMLRNGATANFGRLITKGLSIGTKFSILWPIMIILGLFILVNGLGYMVAHYVVRENESNFTIYLAQVVRYSIILLPVCIITFIYALFSNPIIIGLVLFIMCIVPIFLIVANVLYILQVQGDPVFDRVYIIYCYTTIALLISYYLYSPIISSFLTAMKLN